MSTTLLQTSVAAFPDRPANVPADQRAGLRVTLDLGQDGAYLQHLLPQPATSLRSRFMLRLGDNTAGKVVILRGLDGAGDETFRLDCDAGEHALTLRIITGPSVTANLSTELDWHCVELHLDAVAQRLALRINGVRVAEAATDLSTLATRALWLGGLCKETQAQGKIDLDEWIIVTGDGDEIEQPIGPVVVPPASPFADDPARWLVIYNRDWPESVAFSEAYRQARGVPCANLCGLSLPMSETIGTTDFAALHAAINTYLVENHLADWITGLLLGYGVPGLVDAPGGPQPVAALLHMDAPGVGAVFNPLFDTTGESQRLTSESLQGLRLTARIDAPDLASAIALIHRADVLREAPLNPSPSAAIHIGGPLPPTAFTQAHADLLAWGESLSRQATRLPVNILDATTASITGDLFLWAWTSASGIAPENFFASMGDDPCVFALPLSATAATVTSLRAWPDSRNDDWATASINAGYAAIGVASGPLAPVLVPHPAPFFNALRQGWTLAEAWLLCQPVLRDRLCLIGDSLATVALPRAGWNLYGPLGRVEEFNPDKPVAMLPVAARAFALPAGSQPGLWILQSVDDQGCAGAAVSLPI